MKYNRPFKLWFVSSNPATRVTKKVFGHRIYRTFEKSIIFSRKEKWYLESVHGFSIFKFEITFRRLQNNHILKCNSLEDVGTRSKRHVIALTWVKMRSEGSPEYLQKFRSNHKAMTDHSCHKDSDSVINDRCNKESHSTSAKKMTKPRWQITHVTLQNLSKEKHKLHAPCMVGIIVGEHWQRPRRLKRLFRGRRHPLVFSLFGRWRIKFLAPDSPKQRSILPNKLGNG